MTSLIVVGQEKPIRIKEPKKKMGYIKPKAPELIRKIEWVRRYGREHVKLLIVASVVVAVFVSWKCFTSEQILRFFKSNIYKDSPENKMDAQAPLIRFADGTRGTVNFSYQVQIDTNLIIESFKLYGSAEAALSSLKTSVYGATISVLETKTQDYVRKHRAEVASEIIERTKEAQKRTAYKVFELSIGEIL